MASDLIKVVTDKTFTTEVEQSGTPVLLDFTATWCGPCKALAPILDSVAQEYTGKIQVAKLDIDDSPDTPSRFGIRGVPTVILFKDGKEVARHVGLAPKTKIIEMFRNHIQG